MRIKEILQDILPEYESLERDALLLEYFVSKSSVNRIMQLEHVPEISPGVVNFDHPKIIDIISDAKRTAILDYLSDICLEMSLCKKLFIEEKFKEIFDS